MSVSARSRRRALHNSSKNRLTRALFSAADIFLHLHANDFGAIVIARCRGSYPIRGCCQDSKAQTGCNVMRPTPWPAEPPQIEMRTRKIFIRRVRKLIRGDHHAQRAHALEV